MSACTHDHAHPKADVAAALAHAEALCGAQGHRWTEPRRRVLELLVEAGEPVKAYDLMASYGAEGAKPATVYRALEFLEKVGLVHRIVSLSAFQACIGHDGAHGAATPRGCSVPRSHSCSQCSARPSSSRVVRRRPRRLPITYVRGAESLQGQTRAESWSRVKRFAPPRTSRRATTYITAPTARPIGRSTMSRPELCPTAMKIRGRITAPPSWFASWLVRARAEGYGIRIAFAEPETVDIPAFAGTVTLRYARPVDPTPAPSAGG